MKKLYFLGIAFFFIGATFAQIPSKEQNDKEELNIDLSAFIKHFKSKTQAKSIESRWYNYAFAIDTVFNLGEINANTLWPDTTIWVTYISGNVASPWIHSMTTILDPVSTWFNDYGTPNLKIYPHMPYTLDSIGYYFLYYRNYTDTTTVDTLTFDVFTRNADTNQKYYIAQHPGYPSYDTVWFLGIDFDATSGELDFPYTSYTILLDESSLADTTAGGFNYFEFPITGFAQINAGDKIGVRVRYKPGHSYTPFVDSTSQINYIRLLSYEEYGDNTYPNYLPGDWNVSSIGRTDSWFEPGDNWHELEVSTFGFVASYPLEDHLINFHLTADYNIGIEDNEYALVFLYPNPANEYLYIDLRINENAQYEILDIINKTIQNGLLNENKNIINVSDISPGMYIVNITYNNQIFSKKILIE
ncbi:T9SS type A sorting domain-containing protein [candidate division KSB1 bacterium]